MMTIAVSTQIARVSLCVGLALAVGAYAAICDKTYYMQNGSLYTLTGATPATLASSARVTVGTNMAGVEAIHPQTEYEMVTRFEGNGACADWKKTNVDMAIRKAGASAFNNQATTSNYIRLHSTPYPFAANVNFEYWFGFAESLSGDTARIFEAIGKLKNGGPNLHVWYGTATMTRNFKDRVLGTPKGSVTHFYQALTSHPDSAALQNGLLDSWKNEKDNDTQTVSFKVQMLKVLYDSVPPPTGIRDRGGMASKSKSAGFQASRSGNLMLIRPAEGKVAPDEALGLFNMMGHKIATLHPTGYLYQWNGRTAAGAEAPTGVYFVQSGSRILGKFFYSR